MFKEFFFWVNQTKAARIFGIVAFVLSMAYYALELYNGRAQMADFRVYFDASNALMHNYQLYGVPFGISSGFFKYSPVAALIFCPLGLLKYGVASFIYYVLVTVGAIHFILFLAYFLRRSVLRIAHIENREIVVFLVLLTVFMADHLERELHLGNVNLFLLILSFVCFLNLNPRPILAGLVFALVLLLKPHFIVVIPYLIWKKQWKPLAACLCGIGLGIMLPAGLVGWEYNVELHRQWLDAMLAHNISLAQSPNTIYGICSEYILKVTSSNTLIISVLIAVVGLFLALMWRNIFKAGKGKIWYIEFFVLIALIPNLTHTDTEHFMWSMPLVAYSLFLIVTQWFCARWFAAALLVLAFIPYTLNSPDIVGKETRLLFDERGFLGMANLIIILVAVYIHFSISASISRRLVLTE